MSNDLSTLTLEQLVFTLKRLPREDLERLDLMLDDDFNNLILERSKIAWQEHKKGETLSLEEIKKEFSV